MTAAWLVLMGFLSLVGCTSEPDGPATCNGVYHWHTSYPAELRAGALDGVAGWNAFATRQVSVDGTSDEVECSFRAIPADGPEYQTIAAEHGGPFMAYSYRDHSIILADGPYLRGCIRYMGPPCLVSTFEHELGHAHGMEHLVGCAVMNPGEIPTGFSSKDRAECERAGACS